MNASRPGAINITAKRLRWGSQEDIDEVLGTLSRHKDIPTETEEISRKFDVIFAADCLFFKEFHSELHQTLDALLSGDGCALMLQPSRGKTLEQFVRQVEELGVFEAHIHTDYLHEVRCQVISLFCVMTNNLTLCVGCR
jgi:calmodulin-lysine N-methyltransferase